MRTRFARRRHCALGVAAAVVATALAAGTLAGCSAFDGGQSGSGKASSGPASTDYFGYLTDSGLETTNAASAFGIATGAQVLSGRLYPAPFVSGPYGQSVPNSDLVSTEVVKPGNDQESKQVHYRISERAKYSDGVPVTCNDFLLAYKAGVMKEEFGSHVPLADEVESLDCAPGAKDFTVTFKVGEGQRWRLLFGPGTVLPSHTIAAKANLSQEDLVAALDAENSWSLQEVARLWRFGFSTENFDPQLQVSFGPYKVDHVGDAGEVVLVANETYYGPAPQIERLVLWPRDANGAALADSGSLRIVDASATSPSWLNLNASESNYEEQRLVGELTDTLFISHSGALASQSARQAFAACVDHEALAKTSSQVSGVEVPAVYQHTLSPLDPTANHLSGLADKHRGTHPELAGQLAGTTVRVSYLAPNERLGAMVKTLKDACASAGITVEDVSAPNASQATLDPNPETGAIEADVYLGPADPASDFGGPVANISEAAKLLKHEDQLWTALDAIPVSAQPRVFLVDRAVDNVVPYTGQAGIGWNMDRWRDTGNDNRGAQAPAGADSATTSNGADGDR